VTLVIDASFVAAGLLPDEAGVSLAEIAARDSDICAPALLPLEVWNLLLMAERRQRIEPARCDLLLARFDDLQIRVDRHPDPFRTIALARRHHLTVYDALYLDLAIREGGSLATWDRKLTAAARAEGVTLA
jgi:predicted nucleic acid-binding protein